MDLMRVSVLDRFRLGGSLIDRIDLYAVLAALVDLLPLKLKSLLGAVPTVEKAAVGMHMHRPCRLTRADIVGLG